MNARAAVSLTAIATVLVLGITYMTVGVLHLDPRRSHITADLRLADSGGLGPNAPVLLRGVQVGRAQEVRKQAQGVLVRLEIDTRYRIPLSSNVIIEQLSALGEPYIEFEPPDGSGPYLANGQVVPTDRIRTPMTITALSSRLVELLNQFRPEVMARLVDTFDQALAGTDATMQTLQRSTTLLATTLLSRTAAVRQLFSDIQSMGGDIDWLGPSLAAAGPELGEFGNFLNRIVEQGQGLVEARPTSDYFTGDGVVPFLDNTTNLLNKIGPSIAPLAPVLRPAVADAVHRTPNIDISALIDQALGSVDTDGTLHFRIGVK
ncbi:MlaD family protein [Nocardia sp. BMG51109]|uniref:MlaD family protein n=1 Tax=Nocardia sp. BMG51109 TaxID=1056816 RepID=UPI0004647DA7|nr:MlaD family protein [Nocardia sp. BMG51109]